MIGGIFLLLILWLVFALGEIEKGQKFWSYHLIGPTAYVVVMGLVILFDSPSNSELTLKEAVRFIIALSVGLTAVVTGRKDFENKLSPMAAGITRLFVVFGFTILVFNIAMWGSK